MFSNKELVVFAASIGVGLSYMIFKLSYEMAKGMAKQDIAALRNFMLNYQIMVFVLYILLFAVLASLLAVSKRFLKNPKRENFEKSDWLLKASETLALFVAISFIMAMFDGIYFLGMWIIDTLNALKFSCFFYWIYRVGNDPIPELSELAVLWQIPVVIFDLIFGMFAYRKYFAAKRLFNNLFPNIPRDGIYNAFFTRRKKWNDVYFKAPEDILDMSESTDKADPSPLRKPLGSNSLFSVDSPKKEKNILKTQAEIDMEEGNFFAGLILDEEKAAEISGIAAEMEGESAVPAADELIPDSLDFIKSNRSEDKPEEKELIPCPLCGSLSFKGSRECDFCGAALAELKEGN